MLARLLSLAFAVASIVGAATVPDLPACANSCIGSFGSCQTLDVKCICSDQALIADLACCVSVNCDAADQNKTITFADALCAGQGVSNLPKSATCAPGAVSTPVSGTSVATAGSTTTANGTVAATTSATSAASSVSSAISSASAAAASTTSSAPSSAASASTTAAKAGAISDRLGGMSFGAFIAGLIVAL